MLELDASHGEGGGQVLRPRRRARPTPSSHLATVAWLVEQFEAARIALRDGPPGRIVVTPSPRAPGRP